MSATKLSPQNTDNAAFDAARDAMLKLDDVMIMRGGRILFQNVSFSLARGAVVQLTGGNGTGKTSLLRALAGALPVAEGSVAVAPDATFSFLPADDALWGGQQSLRAALNDWAAMLGVDRARVNDVLLQLDLVALADRALAVLSMGQKRRLSWARMLLRPGSMWLLDEPFNSLDRDSRLRITTLLGAHLASGGSAVIACHDDVAAMLGGVGVTPVLLGGGAR